MKQKSFAAKVDRHEVYHGSELFGVDLAQHIDFIVEVLEANKTELDLE